MLPTAHNSSDYYMMNPISKRSIVIGGRVYKNLVKRGIIDPSTNEQFEHKEDKPLLTEQEEDEEKLIELEDDDVLVVNDLERLVVDLEEKKIDTDELSKVVARASENVMIKYKDKLAEIKNDDELYDEVKKLIDDEIKIILTI